MSLPTAGMTVATDGSDIIASQYIQTNGAPGGASETFNVRGFAVDLIASQVNAKTANTMIGNFTQNI